MIRVVKKSVQDWKFDCVSLGFPGPSINECPLREPHNLGGWMGFNFRKALGCPAKIIYDAAMQALGSYQGGGMLFLGYRPRGGHDRERDAPAHGVGTPDLQRQNL
jgi:polyphosphate glucokinase